MGFRINSLPLVKSAPHLNDMINLPLTPMPKNHYFYSSPYVFEQDKKIFIMISSISDLNYIIHDKVKVIGYVVAGEYFDFKNIY